MSTKPVYPQKNCVGRIAVVMNSIMLGHRMKSEAILNVSNMFPQTDLHGPFSPAYILEPARALQ